MAICPKPSVIRPSSPNWRPRRPELAAVPARATAVIDAWIRRELVHIAVALATNATANTGLTGAESLALAQRRLAELHPRPCIDGEPS